MALLASFLRGAGLSIIPDLFDTRRPAAAEFQGILRATKKPAAGAQAAAFRGEIRLKASYFLASMYLREEAEGEARKVLAAMAEEAGPGSFYRDWAEKRLGRGNR